MAKGKLLWIESGDDNFNLWEGECEYFDGLTGPFHKLILRYGKQKLVSGGATSSSEEPKPPCTFEEISVPSEQGDDAYIGDVRLNFQSRIGAGGPDERQH